MRSAAPVSVKEISSARAPLTPDMAFTTSAAFRLPCAAVQRRSQSSRPASSSRTSTGCKQVAKRSERLVVRSTPEQDQRMASLKAEYEAAMADPAKKAMIEKQMEMLGKAMQSEEAKASMQAMQGFMTNPEMREKVKALANDPEMKDFFDELKAKGPQALMKYWNDPVMLKKMSEKLGGTQAIAAAVGTQAPGAAAAAVPPPPQQPPAEVNNLHDAARWSDLEACEDLIAVGKDVNAQDPAKRTPLHYAVAYGKDEDGYAVAMELIKAGAKLELADAKSNTPLHYAAGYGRPEYVRLLLDSGASPTARNDTGKTPLELVKLSEQNPLNKEAELLKRLTPEAAAAAGTFFRDQ